MNCRSASRLIDRVVDGVATDHERNLLRFHINGCPRCRRRLELTRDISQVMKTISAPTPPSDLESSVRTMLRTGEDLEAAPVRSSGRLGQRLLVGLPFAAAAAAVFLAISSFTPGGHSRIDPTTGDLTAASYEQRKIPRDRGFSSSKAVSTEEVSLAPLEPYQRSANIVSF
jgi:anti-sigma factor RsiW